MTFCVVKLTYYAVLLNAVTHKKEARLCLFFVLYMAECYQKLS